MNISQTHEQINALNAFQNHCELEDIKLLFCNATRAKAGTEFQEPFSVRPALTSVSPVEDEGRIIVEVGFEYSAWDSSEPAVRLFLVNCIFEASYRLRDGYKPTAEERSSFSKGTAVFNCWPYAREFLSDITSRLGHQTPVLPLLRITPKKQETATMQPTLSPVAEVKALP